MILSDTVGFISDLPHELVAAFRATLEEVAEADIILHVRDVAHPDTASQRADVVAVLDSMVTDGTIDADWRTRCIEVLNKADLLGGVAALPFEARPATPSRCRRSPARGWTRWRRRSTRGSPPAWRRRTTRSRTSDGARLAWLYQHGEVLDRAGRRRVRCR